MDRWALAVAILLVASLTATVTPARGPDQRAAGTRFTTVLPERVADQLDTYLGDLARSGDFRGEVLVARGDSVLFKGTYLLPHEILEKRGRHERFPIASLTKTVTAAAVLLLHDAGRLNLRDPVSRYVPNLPCASSMTIEMLLTHRSGLPNESTFPDFVDRLDEPLTLQQTIERLGTRPLDFEPGTRAAYSNSGYMVLAYIIERVTGQSFDQFVDSALLRPLGLHEIEPAAAAAAAGRLAPGFFVGPPPRLVVPAPAIEFSHATGSGSLSASATDLYRWARSAMRGELLSVRSRPFGWSVNQRLGMRTYEQTGTLPGYLAAVIWFEAEDLYVVFLSSIQSGVAFFRAPTALASIVLGRSYDHPPFYQAGSLAKGIAGAAAGDYTDGTGAQMSIVRRGTDLLLRFPPSRWPYGDTYLTPISDTTVLARSDDALIHFHREAGAVTALTWEQPGNTVWWTRVR